MTKQEIKKQLTELKAQRSQLEQKYNSLKQDLRIAFMFNEESEILDSTLAAKDEIQDKLYTVDDEIEKLEDMLSGIDD